MSKSFNDNEKRRLATILASLLEAPELQKEISQDTDMIVQAARQAIHDSMSDKKVPLLPSELEGHTLLVEGQALIINSSKFHFDEKNAYAGGKLVLDCTPRQV